MERPILNLRRILIPTDFSDISLDALEYGKVIARQAGSEEIILFHAVESFEYSSAITIEGQQAITEALQKGIQEKLEEIQKERLAGFKSRLIVQPGRLYRVLEKVIAEEGVGLVIMGTHGASSLIESPQRFFLGSNAYRTVMAAPCPVITIRERKDPIQFKNVVLPLDVTKETTQKVGIAIQWAKLFGSTIHAISVTSFLDEYLHDIYRLEWVLNQVVQEIREHGISVVTHVLRYERVANAVIEYARSVDADLIIIMTRQERRWNEMFVGSAARTVIERSPIPVMSVRPLPPALTKEEG